MTENPFPFEEGDTVKISFEADVTTVYTLVSDRYFAEFSFSDPAGDCQFIDTEKLPEDTKYEVVRKKPLEVGWWEVTYNGSSKSFVMWWSGHYWIDSPNSVDILSSRSGYEAVKYLGKGSQDAN
jgi:hypothetical protein